MKKAHLLEFVIIFIVSLVGCSKTPPTESPLNTPATAFSPIPTPASLDVTQARVMFLSNRDGEPGWYSMEPDGSNVWHFDSLQTAKTREIVWIPDLKAFAGFLSLDGQENLYLLDAQGNVEQHLTSALASGSTLAYSSAAKQFAFTCVRSDLDICTVSIHGGEISNLSDLPSRESSPDWSPSGEQILFVSNRDVVPDVWVMNRDGSDVQHLTATGQPHGSPHWSPDGGKILFTSQRDYNWEVYVMDANGRNPVNLTNDPMMDIEPQWSPDGEYIAFRSNRTGDDDIYTMKIDGTELVNLTNSPGSNENTFTWSPDSEQVLYTSDADGDWDIYIVNRDGTEPTNLTNNTNDDFAPQWIYY